MAAVETSQEPPLVPCPPVLPPSTDPEPTFSYPESYDSLSHCVRTNIFPGAPLPWKSLSMLSYVQHPVLPWPADPSRWFGHKTDDLVQWTERNLVNQTVHKMLKKKKTTSK